jgi:parallel beta-helix repeat protein
MGINGDSKKKFSFRTKIKTLLLLFAGLFVLFPHLSGIYYPSIEANTSGAFSNVQICEENKIITAKNEKGTVIYSGSDDAKAIEAAINELDNGVITFQKGEYNINRTISLKSNISFVGDEGVVFKCNRAPAFNTGTCGYSSSEISLKKDVSSGDTQVVLSSVAKLKVGDYVKISDDFSVSYQGSYYKNGELAEIVDISGTTIRVSNPLYSNYTIANNARVRKISMLENISFENIDFIGYGMGTTSTAISFYGVKNIKISNCGFEDFGTRGISFFDCLDCLVEGNTFQRIFRDGTGYGIAITNACDNVVIKNNSFLEKGRHYIAIVASRGGVTTDGFTRHVDILDNVFRDCADEAVNSHPTSAATINVIGNEFYNSRKGIEFSNSDSVIQNNTFVGCVNGVVLFDPGNHLVEGNHFKDNKISIIPHSTNSTIRDNFFD